MESARPKLHAAGFFGLFLTLIARQGLEANSLRQQTNKGFFRDGFEARDWQQKLFLVVDGPWLALRANNIPFDEVFIPLYTGEADKKRILSFTHSGKVPALIDGDVTVWDSLAIIEYVAERFPQTRLWPEDPARRAHARSISAEMHSGFAAVRNECGMNLHRPVRAIALSADARADIERIQQIWIECRERYGKFGPFLFGNFGGADAMFAPVVHRFRTYAIEVAPEVQAYMDTMMSLPAFQEWTRAALAETLVIEKFETV